jgi:hypothetical protein
MEVDFDDGVGIACTGFDTERYVVRGRLDGEEEEGLVAVPFS